MMRSEHFAEELLDHVLLIFWGKRREMLDALYQARILVTDEIDHLSHCDEWLDLTLAGVIAACAETLPAEDCPQELADDLYAFCVDLGVSPVSFDPFRDFPPGSFEEAYPHPEGISNQERYRQEEPDKIAAAWMVGPEGSRDPGMSRNVDESSDGRPFSYDDHHQGHSHHPELLAKAREEPSRSIGKALNPQEPLSAGGDMVNLNALWTDSFSDRKGGKKESHVDGRLGKEPEQEEAINRKDLLGARTAGEGGSDDGVRGVVNAGSGGGDGFSFGCSTVIEEEEDEDRKSVV